MKNSIDVRVEFSFRGDTYSPSATIDLDAMMVKGGELSDLHGFLATQHGIDTYSYTYEVMEAHELEFYNARGLAEQCLEGVIFDIQHFQQLWRENKEYSLLADIAKQFLDIERLDEHKEIKAALIAAFEEGKKQ